MPIEADLIAATTNGTVIFGKEDTCAYYWANLGLRQYREVKTEAPLKKITRNAQNAVTVRIDNSGKKEEPLTILPDGSTLTFERFIPSRNYFDDCIDAILPKYTLCQYTNNSRPKPIFFYVYSRPVDLAFDSENNTTYIIFEDGTIERIDRRSPIGTHPGFIQDSAKTSKFKLALNADSVITAGNDKLIRWAKAKSPDQKPIEEEDYPGIKAIAVFPESAPEDFVISAGKQLEVRYKKSHVLAALREVLP
jgi:hypothetical protein